MIQSLYGSALIASISASIYLHSNEKDGSDPLVSMPRSCIGQEDGYQWFKPLGGNTHRPVYQKCDNEYMILDYNEHPNIADYFRSFDQWHTAIAGPEAGATGTWEDWWEPSWEFVHNMTEEEIANDEYFSFIISPDCSTCDVANNIDNNYLADYGDFDDYDDRMAYHMTSALFGCSSQLDSAKDAMWNMDTYECPSVNWDSSDSDLGYHVSWHGDDDWGEDGSIVGLCGVVPRVTYDASFVLNDRQNCFDGDYMKPSIGTKGEFCVCVKPNPSFNATDTHESKTSEMTTAQEVYDAQHAEAEEDNSSIDDVYALYQDDFEYGTFRISKSGTYKIMEDITFDFENNNNWWPSSNQTEYPGADTSRDEYALGFIAGITVEADDVIIDLNDHEIKMSMALYFQQRFFSCIMLKSVTFPLTQGPGIFGMEPVYANNVVIKNGKIGLSSHHGIHGHYNDDVVIENVHVYDFETHGIQMSYFNNLKMKNVEIGPSSTVAFLKGEYGYARWTLQRLNRIIESDYDETAFPLTLSEREDTLSLQDAIDHLQNLVDIAFAAVMGTEEFDDDDEDYIAAKELFINEGGVPYGAVMYGLFLNSWVSNVFAVHPTLRHAAGAEIENVKIHGLYHEMREYIRMDDGESSPYQNMWTSAFDARAFLGEAVDDGQDIDWAETKYVGNALTDAYLALYTATSDWGEMGLIYFEGADDSEYQLYDWAMGRYQFSSDSHPALGCNNDRMSHVPKGIIGVRMDGVKDVTFTDLEISDFHESGDLGSESCGEYWEDIEQFEGGGHFLQNAPYFYGYTGNRVHGMFMDWANVTFSGDISVHDLVSETGLVRGIGMYTKTQLTMNDDAEISIHDLAAGTALSDVDTDSLPHPYAPAEVKPVHYLSEWKETVLPEGGESKVFYSEIIGEFNPTVWCLYGRDGAHTSDLTVTVVDDAECSSTVTSASELAVNIKTLGGVQKTSSWNTNNVSLTTAMVSIISLVTMMILYISYRVWLGQKSKIETEYAPLL